MTHADLRGKVAIVTGALGLLGREHCAALAGAGARVVVVDLDQERCAEFAQQVASSYGVATAGFGVDITEPAEVDRLRDGVLARFDALDILVNNAAIDDKVVPGASDESRFENYPLERFRHVL